jgi:hypothetical protein
MLDRAWALAFAREWVEAWNSHDLERILSHYVDDFEMSSPLIVERLGRPEGVIRGKREAADYWRPSMRLDPPLHFELLDVLVGVDQLTIYYRSVGRRVVAETLVFDGSGKAIRGAAQWSVMEPEGTEEPA